MIGGLLDRKKMCIGNVGIEIPGNDSFRCDCQYTGVIVAHVSSVVQ